MRPVFSDAVLSAWIASHESTWSESGEPLLANGSAARCARLAGEPGTREAEADDQRAAALHERLARELLLVQEARHHAPPFAITAAAFWIAVRILGYVPQRQRCPFIAVRIWSSDGFFVVARRSAAWIIIPFWQ